MMNWSTEKLASRTRLVPFVAILLMGISLSESSAQNALEFPQQTRQPVESYPTNQRGRVAQASYQAPINEAPNKASVENRPLTAQGAGFPTLVPAKQTTDAKPASKSKSFGPMATTAFSLAVVLGLFAGLVWVTRRYGNGSMTPGRVPSDILKSLGSTSIDARTQVTMLRCGNRIIVIAQTANGVHPLSEITDPAEVNRLTIACTGDIGPTFAETLQQVDVDTSPRNQQTNAQDKRGRLFASA